MTSKLWKLAGSGMVYLTAFGLVMVGLVVIGFAPLCDQITSNQASGLIAAGIVVFVAGSGIIVSWASR